VAVPDHCGLLDFARAIVQTPDHRLKPVLTSFAWSKLVLRRSALATQTKLSGEAGWILAGGLTLKPVSFRLIEQYASNTQAQERCGGQVGARCLG
jgi:hypothetical protein